MKRVSIFTTLTLSVILLILSVMACSPASSPSSTSTAVASTVVSSTAVASTAATSTSATSPVVTSNSATSTSVTTPTTSPAQSSSPVSTTAPAGREPWSPDGIIKAREYSGSTSYGDFSINWRSDGEFIFIGVSADTDGWVAVAFQPGTGMKDADMLIGLVKNGKAEVVDAYCTDNLGSHPADTQLGGTADILAFGGKEEGGTTVIEIKRLLKTGDQYDLDIAQGPNKIIWSYGTSDSLSAKHAVRGYGVINP